MEVIKRKSCRAILLTPDNEVLLIKIGTTLEGWVGWITPGGGLDEGESEEQGLRRELAEELGIDSFDIAGKIWSRSHQFIWNGRQIYQDEVFFLIRVDKFEPVARHLTDIERAEFKGMQWWPIAEMETSGERFAPAKLALHLKDILSQGIPKTLIVIGD